MILGLFYVLLAAAMFFLAGLVVLSIFGAKFGARHLGETRTLQLVMILLTFGATVLPAGIRISSGVDTSDSRMISQIQEGIGWFVWSKRFITIGSLVIALSGFLHLYRRQLWQQLPSRQLLVAYLTFVVMNFVLGAIFSTVPAFVPQIHYPLIILLLAFLSAQADMRALLLTARICLGLVVIGSLIVLAYPKWGFARFSSSMIPGLPGRFAGITLHPNDMGPLSLMYILLASIAPIRNRWLQYFMYTAAFATLILSQSKTVWVAGVAAVSLVLLFRFQTVWRQRMSESSGWILLGVAVGLFSLVVAAVLAFLVVNELVPIGFLRNRSIVNLATVVGRTEIWSITLDLWERSPWFGYGPTIWSPEFRMQHAMPYVGQAHNQFIQTLGESGVFGLVGLLIYLIAIIVAVAKTVGVSRGVSMALAAQFFVRCLTEAPVRTMGISDTTFLLHFIFVVCLLNWYQQVNASSQLGSERS